MLRRPRRPPLAAQPSTIAVSLSGSAAPKPPRSRSFSLRSAAVAVLAVVQACYAVHAIYARRHTPCPASFADGDDPDPAWANATAAAAAAADNLLSPRALAPLKRAAEARARAGKAVVYYQHVHKAGGSTLCELARSNGLRVSGRNCLPVEPGGSSALVRVWERSADAQLRWLARVKYDFVAMEVRAPPSERPADPHSSRRTASSPPRRPPARWCT